MSRFPNDAFPEYSTRKFAKWPDSQQILELFKSCQEQKPEFFGFKEIGKSVQGRSIYAAELTDFAVAEQNKQTAVFLATEHGGERSAAGAALELIKWLLSPGGGETLKKQRVLIVPVVNVDSYDSDGRLVNMNGVNLYTDYKYDGSEPSQPEARAVWQLLEEVKPDLFVSMHGMSMDYDICGYHRTWESTGIAFTNNVESPYNRKIISKVNAAAEAEGYSMDLGAEDLERILPFMPGCKHHSLPTFSFYGGSASYCYNRFHSLSMGMEIGPVRSGFLRCRKLLNIGNGRWEYECFDGYPNRIITAACISTMVLTAGGANPAVRRENRCKLWRHSHNITTGIGERNSDQILGFYSRCRKDYSELEKFKNTGALLEYFETEGIKIDELLKQLGENWKQPVLVWNDAKAVKINDKSNNKASYDLSVDSENTSMELCMRFRLDLETNPLDVLVNDRLLDSKEFRIWQDLRFKYVEVDLPPETKRAVVFVKTTERNK